MSSGERPMGAARGKQSDTEALCQTPRGGVGGGGVDKGRPHGVSPAPHHVFATQSNQVSRSRRKDITTSSIPPSSKSPHPPRHTPASHSHSRMSNSHPSPSLLCGGPSDKGCTTVLTVRMSSQMSDGAQPTTPVKTLRCSTCSTRGQPLDPRSRKGGGVGTPLLKGGGGLEVLCGAPALEGPPSEGRGIWKRGTKPPPPFPFQFSKGPDPLTNRSTLGERLQECGLRRQGPGRGGLPGLRANMSPTDTVPVPLLCC